MGSSASIEDSDRPIVMFDGVCNLCNGAVQFILKRDHAKKFRFASLQSEFAVKATMGFDVTPSDLYSIILLKNGRLYDRTDALLEIARDLPGVWKTFYVFKFIPRFLRDGLYKIVANNRYKLFGKEESCIMPTPELRSRFLDL